ncbi:MAG: methylmalonyl-CoA mutase, partial [Bacteroidetes bacterium]|nr:methylmalonyl-CoA mutase [Bacteroidota bacterium]
FISDAVNPPILRVDDSIRVQQIEKLKQVKAERDNEKVKADLARLEQAAKDGSNVMPIIIDAVENYASLGEIADTFRGLFGEYKA